MLKKILSIFFILCLVFSLTVPCFAAPILTDPTPSRTSTYLYNGSDKIIMYGVLANSVSFRINSTTGSIYYLNYNFLYYLDPSDTFYFYYNNVQDIYFSVNGSPLVKYDFNTPYTFPPGSTVIFCGSNLTLYFYKISSIDPFSISFNTTAYNSLSAADVSSIYICYRNPNSTITGLSGYYDINGTPTFLNDPLPVSSSTTISRWTGLDPFIDFHQHVFESLTFIGELPTTYNLPFILIVSVVSLLVFIFVVVFMIKRFTGGKT